MIRSCRIRADPVLHEDYTQSAIGYVQLAEAANGPIPRSVDPTYIWGAALDEFARMRPHSRVINLETSITHSEDYEPKGINYRMSPENAECLRAAAIDCCVLGNNHVLDWGRGGLLETLATLEHLDDFLVRNLIKVSIIKADCAEDLVVFETDDIVSVVAQQSKASCRCYRHREHEFLWIAHAGGAQSCAGRRAGGDAIVNHDRCATDDLDGWSESMDGTTIRHAGTLDRLRLSREDCEAIIINARIKAGWIT